MPLKAQEQLLCRVVRGGRGCTGALDQCLISNCKVSSTAQRPIQACPRDPAIKARKATRAQNLPVFCVLKVYVPLPDARQLLAHAGAYLIRCRPTEYSTSAAYPMQVMQVDVAVGRERINQRRSSGT